MGRNDYAGARYNYENERNKGLYKAGYSPAPSAPSLDITINQVFN